MAGSGIDALLRSSDKDQLKRGIKRAETNEKIEALLPRLDLPREGGILHYDDAVAKLRLQYEIFERETEIDSLKRPGGFIDEDDLAEQAGAFRREIALGIVAFEFSEFRSYRSHQENLAWAALRIVTQHMQDGLPDEKALQAADFLTTNMPLMQGVRTRIQPDPETGLKTWRGYLAQLADPARPQRLQALAEVAHYPATLMPERLKSSV